MSDIGLFSIRLYKGRSYNIFALDDGQFEGRVFDQFRRVDYKTYPLSCVRAAVEHSRDIIEKLNKGQCPCGIRVDEGREIRVREEKQRLEAMKMRR